MPGGPSKKPFVYRHGSALTTHHIRPLLNHILEEIGRTYKERPDLIVAAWPEVVGSQLAPMTEALSFCEGILVVRVKNATLYSLLSRNDKPRLIKNLRDKFPGTTIKTIVFRLS